VSDQRLFVLCGLPFSGKSTLARAIATRFGPTHLELDAIVAERGPIGDGLPVPRESWIAAYREAYRRMDALLAQGHSVVFDATGHRRVHRDLARRHAARFGTTTVVVALDVQEAVARARRDRNRIAPIRYDVPDAEFDLVAAEIQPPGDEEHVVRYSSAMDLDAWLQTLP